LFSNFIVKTDFESIFKIQKKTFVVNLYLFFQKKNGIKCVVAIIERGKTVIKTA